MTPKDIARLIMEDEDDSDGMPGPILLPEPPKEPKKPPAEPEAAEEPEPKKEPAKSTGKPKKTTKKPAPPEDQEYEVDKITGQPKNGTILYSDTQPGKPVTENTAENKPEAKQHLYSIVSDFDQQFWATIENKASTWNQGADLGVKEAPRFQDNLFHNFSQLGLIKTYLGRLGLLNQVKAFVEDFNRLNPLLIKGIQDPDNSDIDFPPKGWWHYTAMNTGRKKQYVKIFYGEVATRFLGRVIKKYKEARATCQDKLCTQTDHINDLVKAIQGVSLVAVYENFKAIRRLQIANFKKREKPDQEGPISLPKETIDKLININKRYLDELYHILKESGKSNLEIRSSGLPTLSVKVNDYLDDRYLLGILGKFQQLHPTVYEFQAQRFFPNKKQPMAPKDIIASIRERLGIDPSMIIQNNPKYSARFYSDMADYEGL